MMAQVREFLPSMWEMFMEFQAPALGLAQP